MIVVPVLITSCQVSEKSKNGPEAAHTKIIKNAPEKAYELPAHDVTAFENRSKKLNFFLLLIRWSEFSGYGFGQGDQKFINYLIKALLMKLMIT